MTDLIGCDNLAGSMPALLAPYETFDDAYRAVKRDLLTRRMSSANG
jgi:hypothetical protein